MKSYHIGLRSSRYLLMWYKYTSAGSSMRTTRLCGGSDRHHGSAIAITGYDAWGIPNEKNQGRFQYTGQAWLPELGMYYYKARIYSPTLGRFMQTDPIGYDDQINLYAYVGNDPVNKTDPTGECTGSAFSNAAGECTTGAGVGPSAHASQNAKTGGTLTIYSAPGTGSGSYAGHAWIGFRSDDETLGEVSFGTFKEGYGPHGGTQGLRKNVEISANYKAATSRSVHITAAQVHAVANVIRATAAKGSDGWSMASNCVTFATAAWRAGTGERLPSGLVNNPSPLSASIWERNGGRNTNIIPYSGNRSPPIVRLRPYN